MNYAREFVSVCAFEHKQNKLDSCNKTKSTTYRMNEYKKKIYKISDTTIPTKEWRTELSVYLNGFCA